MSRTTPSRPVYRGENKLVISIDFGTTFSGTSWALLEDNQVPHIWDVTGFEGQEHIQAPKVPTVLYYDKAGKRQAAGGETLAQNFPAKAENGKWRRVEWFKLLLSPDNLVNKFQNAPKADMPPNKKLVDVIADFLQYMASCARKHFCEAMGANEKTWREMNDKVVYILSHPNGWYTSAHPIMREAAIKAELVPDTDQGKERIIFVSEGEASLHWCTSKGIGRADLRVGSQFIVVDAGGGTIDISSFRTINTIPLEFEESSIPECHLEGSAFVTKAFKTFVEGKLKRSSFGNPHTIGKLVELFDRESKRNFTSPQDDVSMDFGGPQDNDPRVGIAAGKLVVSGADMASFFDPACKAIVDSVGAIVGRVGKAIIVLVGGFAGNTYLFKEVERRLKESNIIGVLRPNDATAKASANGVICFYLDRNVKARMAEWTYGVPCVHVFDPKDPKHIQRKSQVRMNSASGKKLIDGGFFVTLQKGTLVQETKLTRFPFRHNQSTQTSTILDIALECYQGDVSNIEFRDEDCRAGQFRELCRFKAEIPQSSFVRKKVKVKTKDSGKYYYVIDFNIVVSFGATEFKCSIEWKDEKGKLRSGPITPIWT